MPQQCNVINLRKHGNCCAWNYMPVEIRSSNNLCIGIFGFPHFNSQHGGQV